MANPYCTPAEIIEVMPDNQWGTSYDSLFDALARRASRLIDRVCKVEPGFFFADTDQVRYFDGSGETKQYVDALAAVPTKVEVAESGVVDNASDTGGAYTTWSASDYFCWPYNALKRGQPYRRLDLDLLNGSKATWYAYPRSVKITGKWGFSTSVPDEIKQATITQVVRWFKRGQQGFQDVGAITDLGQLRYVNKLDPDIENIVVNFMETTL